MNTLPNDLHRLINKHLSSVDDLFLFDHQQNSQPKNIIKAVVDKNWRWVLYYLQRYQHQTYIYGQAFLGACELGDVELMERFYINNGSHEWYRDGAFYLTKGRHYDLFDSYVSNGTIILTSLVHVGINHGLSMNSDLETILATKYGCIDLFMMAYYNQKYNRYNEMEDTNEELYLYESLLGKIAGRRPVSIYEIENALQIPGSGIQFSRRDHYRSDKRQKIIYKLARYGYHDVLDTIFGSRYPTKFALKAVIHGLMKAKFFDYIDTLVSRIELPKNVVEYILAKCSIYTDNLEMFMKYYKAQHKYSECIYMAIEHSLIILRYLLQLETKETIKNRWYKCKNNVIDPRVARLLRDHKIPNLENVQHPLCKIVSRILNE